MRKKSPKNYSTKIIIFVLFIFVLYMGYTNIRLLKRKNQLQYQYADLSSTKTLTEEKNSELTEEYDMLFDKDYQEKILREKGMYKKEGEGVIVIKDLQEGDDIEYNEDNNQESFFDKVINKIKKLWK